MKFFTYMLTAVWLVGCSSYRTSYDYAPDAGFDRYHTFTIEGLQNEKQAIAISTLVQKRINQSITEQLEGEGLRKVTDGADLAVMYYATTQDKIDLTDMSNYGYVRRYPTDRVDLYQYTEGSLIIDLVETASSELVWRGTATGAVSAGTPEQITRQVNDAVAAILKKYPPR